MMSEYNTVLVWDGLPESELEREAFRKGEGVVRRRTRVIDKGRRIEQSHSVVGGEFDEFDFRTDPGVVREGDEEED